MLLAFDEHMLSRVFFSTNDANVDTKKTRKQYRTSSNENTEISMSQQSVIIIKNSNYYCFHAYLVHDVSRDYTN